MMARAATLAVLWVALAGCESPLGPGVRRADASFDASSSIDAAEPDEDAGSPIDASPVYVDASWDAGVDAPVDAGTRVGPDECPAGPPHASPLADPPPDPGPIVRYTVRPYYTVAPDGVTVRDPVLTGDVLMGGVWLVPLGDTIVVDSFQKNSMNRLCQWIDLPTWSIDDPYCAIYRTAIRNPFLLRARTEHVGDFTLSATIDGVASNVLPVRVVPP